MILDKLDWQPLPTETVRSLLATLLGREDVEQISQNLVARAATLPFYRDTRLARLLIAATSEPSFELFALITDSDASRLDGSSAPIHAANDAEGLKLTADTAADYLRFFLFSVRGDAGPFLLVEEVSRPELNPLASSKVSTGSPVPSPDLSVYSRPLRADGIDDSGKFRFHAVIAYGTSLFECSFTVSPSGQVEMTDEEPLQSALPREALPSLPDLKLPPPPIATASIASAGPPPSVSVLRSLVQLLLEEALTAQAGHTLLQRFNTMTSGSSRLAQFAKFVLTACPVVIVESTIPFVEEEIAQIVRFLGGRKPLPEIVRGRAHIDGGDDTRLLVKVPDDEEPTIVLIPFHSYRSIVDVERVSVELASRDVSVLVGCERSRDLPDPLRRAADLTLHLPELAPALFDRLFVLVMGAATPSGWTAGGTLWVAHVLHTDLQQPKRLGLPAEQAFAYVRDRVTERLRSVDPLSGPRLADLQGLTEARLFAQDLIADIHEAIAGRLPWADVDRGVLLVGPPGTGKTTLARAIAKDCGVKFVSASAATWQASNHLGEHIRAIRSDFALARRYAPAILFIDEIDSIGNRAQFSGASAQYSLEVVNALLEQIQGLEADAPVIVIAATNFPERVDPALKRAGRLDRVIRISYPNVDALAAIFTNYLQAHTARGSGLASDIDVKLLAQLSLGLTGADVELMVRGAVRRARKARRPLCQADLVDEITGKPRDPALSVRLTVDEIERLSVHEAGHAVARCLSSTGGADITFVSIVPRADGTLGFVASTASGRSLMTRREYMEQLEVVLAGRAAEELTFGEDGVTGGAGGSASNSDLAVATRIATQLIGQYGLGGERKLLWTDTPTASQLAHADQILRETYVSITAKLRSNQSSLLALAAALRQRQELTGQEVTTMILGVRPKQ